jgi:hypothetical protein
LGGTANRGFVPYVAKKKIGAKYIDVKRKMFLEKRDSEEEVYECRC